MKIVSIVLAASLSYPCILCFCPSLSERQGRFLSQGTLRKQDKRIPSKSSTAMFGSADALLRMVEEVSDGQFSPEIVSKMSELEGALATLLEEQRRAQDDANNNVMSPRPPQIPPPLQSFIRAEETQEERVNSLVKAEKALETLRNRLHQEEETLRKAEQALLQSMEEQEVLRRAEIALEKSRAAAEERKQQAIRATEQAMAAAEQTRLDEESAEQLAFQYGLVGEDNANARTQIAREENNNGVGAATPPTNNDAGATNIANVGRPTISLPTLEDDSADNMPVFPSSPDASSYPPGVPILFDWIQYIDGSIQGRVRGSLNFKDGQTVSTSPVPDGAKGGMIITTQSGSRYYLDTVRTPHPSSAGTATAYIKASKPAGAAVQPPVATATKNSNVALFASSTVATNNGNSQNGQSNVSLAPPGVPSILNWELLEDGGISGLVYGSPNAADGDYVETSPIFQGSILSGCVVQTSSGSKYFLSPDKEEQEDNILAAFKDLAAARRGETITITKELNEQSARDALKEMERGDKRSTFSLGDLFGAKAARPKQTSANKGVPTLARWSPNNDGTITGVVYGSKMINDGDLITTSPIASGEIKANAMVATISGSIYYLENEQNF